MTHAAWDGRGTAWSYDRRMTISVIVRAVEQALLAGRLAGEVEVVATGEKTVVSDANELVAFLRRPSEPAGAVAPEGNEAIG